MGARKKVTSVHFFHSCGAPSSASLFDPALARLQIYVYLPSTRLSERRKARNRSRGKRQRNGIIVDLNGLTQRGTRCLLTSSRPFPSSSSKQKTCTHNRFPRPISSPSSPSRASRSSAAQLPRRRSSR